ncbi:MAG: hypothetical protein EOP06_19720 [Proteobacteria bacterium]|nr:MAG: hypothetical protein EOP06_19720 [Pseudomonadota bacterium]
MKKILLLCLAITAMVSCSDDDGASAKSTKSVLKRLQMSSVPGEGTSFDFNYDDKRRITTAIVTGGLNRTTNFTYDDDDRIVRASRSDGEIIDFVYDAQDQLLSYTLNEDNSYLDFNPNTFESTYRPLEYQTNSAGDITHINNGISTFDTSKKGSLANITGVKLQLILFLSDPAFEYAFSKSAMTSVSADNFGTPVFTITFTNSYDNDGMLISTVLRRGGTTDGAISYTYEKL